MCRTCVEHVSKHVESCHGALHQLASLATIDREFALGEFARCISVCCTWSDRLLLSDSLDYVGAMRRELGKLNSRFSIALDAEFWGNVI